MANPIELNYQLDRNVCCIRVDSSSGTGDDFRVYNTVTQNYEDYNSANDDDYQIDLTEGIPGQYRAVCPAGSLSVPATEYFYDMGSDTTLVIANHAPSIGQGNSQGVNIGSINGTPGSVSSNPSAVVDICNLALNQLGLKLITSLSDATENARRCSLIYANLRDELLRDAEWKFATVIAELTENEDVEVPVGWSYAFDVPSDLLKIRRIYSDDSTLLNDPIRFNSHAFAHAPANPPSIPYKQVYDASEDVQVYLTNVETCYIEYTVRIDNPAMYDAIFIKALVFRLAAELAPKLTGDGKKADSNLLRSNDRYSTGARANGNEEGVPRARTSKYIDAR